MFPIVVAITPGSTILSIAVALLTRTDQQQTNSAALLAETQWRTDRQMRARTRLNEETGNKGESAIAMVEIVRSKQQAVIVWIPEDDSKVV
jgi:uncharacterized protein YpmB